MKNYLSKIENFDIQNFISYFSKKNPFGTIISLIALVFLLSLYFTIPTFYNYEKFDKEIQKKVSKDFKLDLKNISVVHNTDALMEKAKIFFKRNGLLLNWKEFEKLDSTQKINTLAMISPVTNEEKQKLLEALTLEDKINTLDNIISFYLHSTNFNNRTIQ